jgi:phosphohistidine phosphatase
MAKEKILFIGRHAKSSWDFPDRDDIDRPLSERGVQNAYVMAGRMKSRGEMPEHIISSPANRALHTAIIYARELDFPLSGLRVNDDLYMTGERTILRIVAQVSNDIGSLMIFGHNPDFTRLANNFLKDQIYNVPTSGIVRLNFGTSEWEKISRSNLVDYFFDFPKNST